MCVWWCHSGFSQKLQYLEGSCYVLSWRHSLYSADVWGEAGTYGESSEGIGGGRMLVERCQNIDVWSDLSTFRKFESLQMLRGWLFYAVGRRWERQTLKVARTAVVWFRAGLVADHSVVGRKGWVFGLKCVLTAPVVQAEACLWCASEQLERSLLVVTFGDFLRCCFCFRTLRVCNGEVLNWNRRTPNVTWPIKLYWRDVILAIKSDWKIPRQSVNPLERKKSYTRFFTAVSKISFPPTLHSLERRSQRGKAKLSEAATALWSHEAGFNSRLLLLKGGGLMQPYRFV